MQRQISQTVARKQAELMAEVRKEEKAQRAAEAAAIADFRTAGAFLLTPEQRAGFLIPLLDADKHHAHKSNWERDGKAHLARLAAEAARPKQVVEVVFPDGGKGPKADMRPLKWSALRRCFEGTMNLDDARRLARSLGGSVKGDADSLPIAAE